MQLANKEKLQYLMLAPELIQMRNGPDFVQLAAKANFSSFCEFLTRASAKKSFSHL